MGTYAVVNSFADMFVAFRGALVRELVARGHRVVVSTPAPEEADPKAVSDAIRALGAEHDVTPLARTSLNPRDELGIARHYRALFDRVRPDGVFATNPKPIFHAMPAARAAGARRTVAMITGLGFAFSSSSPRALLVRSAAMALYARAMRSSTGALFQNSDDLALFRAWRIVPRGLDTRLVGGSGIDLDRFPQTPVPSGPPVFVMVARFLAEKGPREFAAAARIVRASVPEARFRLVGWIDSNPNAIRAEELEAWIREGIVEHAGRLDDVRPELAAASAFVLPSYYREGLPKSALEALATGRPVVTTDSTGCRETVVDGVNGFLVPPRDAQALASACLKIARDPALRTTMGDASRRLAVERFDVRAVNAAVIDALGA